MTCPTNPADCVDAAGSASGSGALDDLRQGVIEATADVITSLGTMWRDTEPVDLTAGDAGGVGTGAPATAQTVTEVLGYVQWIGLVVAGIALIVLMARIGARTRRGEGIAAVGRIGLILGAVVLIGGASSLVGFVLAESDPGSGGAVQFLQSALWWYMGAAAVVAVVVAAIRMAWEQRARPGKDLLRGLLTLVVVAGAGVTIIQALVEISDSFSHWIVRRSLGCEQGGAGCFDERMAQLLILPTGDVDDRLSVGPLTIIIVGFAAIVVACLQIVLMIGRSALLVILAGVLPLAASATTTATGQVWFRRAIGWIAAFILYKPAAAVVYATAFQLSGFRDLYADDESSLVSVLACLMLMTLAVAALPALLRFVMPVAGAGAGVPGGDAEASAVDRPTGAVLTVPSGTSGTRGPSGAHGAAGRHGAAGPHGPSGQSGPSGRTEHAAGRTSKEKPRDNG